MAGAPECGVHRHIGAEDGSMDPVGHRRPRPGQTIVPTIHSLLKLQEPPDRLSMYRPPLIVTCAMCEDTLPSGGDRPLFEPVHKLLHVRFHDRIISPAEDSVSTPEQIIARLRGANAEMWDRLEAVEALHAPVIQHGRAHYLECTRDPARPVAWPCDTYRVAQGDLIE